MCNWFLIKFSTFSNNYSLMQNRQNLCISKCAKLLFIFLLMQHCERKDVLRRMKITKLLKCMVMGKVHLLFRGILVTIIAQSRGLSTTVRVEERKEKRKPFRKLSNREIDRIKKKIVKRPLSTSKDLFSSI